MTAPRYETILTGVLIAGLGLMAIGALCLWLARREAQKREAWLRRWNIIDIRSRNRAS